MRPSASSISVICPASIVYFGAFSDVNSRAPLLPSLADSLIRLIPNLAVLVEDKIMYGAQNLCMGTGACGLPRGLPTTLVLGARPGTAHK
jgi:hypothetical protein